MSRLNTLRYKRRQEARNEITEKEVTRISKRLNPLYDAVKIVSLSSYLTIFNLAEQTRTGCIIIEKMQERR
jgi:hypothetical protein